MEGNFNSLLGYSIQDRVKDTLKYDDTVKYRASMLPLVRTQDDKVRFGYPSLFLDMIGSAMLPAHVMQGGSYTPDDVTKMALDVGMIAAPVGYSTAPKGALAMGGSKKISNNTDDSIKLYRGLTKEFDPNYNLASTDAPMGYSTWTDNPQLAKQYAGNDGFVYEIKMPKSKLGKELIDSTGERALVVNNKKPAGLNNVSGDEYLIYTGHDDYNPSQIKLYNTKSLGDILQNSIKNTKGD
jgi:hypothetical protein